MERELNRREFLASAAAASLALTLESDVAMAQTPSSQLKSIVRTDLRVEAAIQTKYPSSSKPEMGVTVRLRGDMDRAALRKLLAEIRPAFVMTSERALYRWRDIEKTLDAGLPRSDFYLFEATLPILPQLGATVQPRPSVKGLVEEGLVEEIRAAPILEPQVHFSRHEQGLPPQLPQVCAGPAGNPPCHSGAGVIVGIVDFGLDFMHPNLRDPETGATRILWLWDQNKTDVAGAYGSARIQQWITTGDGGGDPYGDYDPHHNYFTADGVGDDGAHGTHVADIAVGNGKATKMPGMAPKADVIFVQARLAQEGGVPVGVTSSSVNEAIDFIISKAGGRPVVINLSISMNHGSHDHWAFAPNVTSLLLRTAPGPVMAVVAAGNYRLARLHASGSLRRNDTRTLNWRVTAGGADPTLNRLQIWYDLPPLSPSTRRLSVELRAPSGEVATLAPNDPERVLPASDGSRDLAKMIRIGPEFPPPGTEPQPNGIEIKIFAPPPSPTSPAPQRGREGWRVIVGNPAAAAGRVVFHAWIDRDGGGAVGADGLPVTQSLFTEGDADPGCTLGSFSCNDDLITVGAYDGANLYQPTFSASSEGPTRQGVSKPEISAPGVLVFGARSKFHKSGLPSYVGKSGTSMAAPHAAGAIALLMEKNPAADRHAIRRALMDSASKLPPFKEPAESWRPRPSQPQPSEPGWNQIWNSQLGAGRLNIRRALARI
jgi:subtilisin family serine protease